MLDSFDQPVNRRGTNSLKWTRYDADVLPLWVADMDFRAPEPVRQALHAAVDHGVFGYEMLTRPLAETVAARMQRLYGWAVSPEMVLTTPGIVAGFNAAARAVCAPGEGILLQPPVYPPFFEVPPNSGTVAQLASLRQVNERHTVRYEIDWPAFEAAVNSNGARTAMFLLCHPHNPTGQIYTRAELERMAGTCLRHNAVICSDEIHSELLLGGARHTPLASLSAEIARRTITLVSASKTFNVVGLFCGFAIIPDPGLRSRYRKVLNQLVLHVNSLGFTAAKEAFSGACDSWLAALRQYLTANRNFVVDFVARELEGVRVTVPDATYLAWLDFAELVRSGRITSGPHQFILERARVGLNPGAEFGSGGDHFVRLNFACPRSTLTEALQRIKRAVNGEKPTVETHEIAPPKPAE
jgi:cysteine-S-conjugate beta-lyase